jgi:hypothetical protein
VGVGLEQRRLRRVQPIQGQGKGLFPRLFLGDARSGVSVGGHVVVLPVVLALVNADKSDLNRGEIILPPA